jgi:hypothetical protein
MLYLLFLHLCQFALIYANSRSGFHSLDHFAPICARSCVFVCVCMSIINVMRCTRALFQRLATYYIFNYLPPSSDVLFTRYLRSFFHFLGHFAPICARSCVFVCVCMSIINVMRCTRALFQRLATCYIFNYLAAAFPAPYSAKYDFIICQC